MSFSADLPTWGVFKEREVAIQGQILSPASEASALLQGNQKQVERLKEILHETQEEKLSALAQQAVYVKQLQAELERNQSALEDASLHKIHRVLRAISLQMLAALQQAELEILVPLGKPFLDVDTWVDVIGWLHHENFSEEVVAEVLEPIIFYRTSLIRPGKVIMGAPLQQPSTQIEDTNDMTTDPDKIKEEF